MPAKKKGAARARSTAEPRASASKTNVRLHCSNEAWMTARQDLDRGPSGRDESVLHAFMRMACRHGTLFPDYGVPRRSKAWPAPMVHEPIPVDADLLARFTRAFARPLGLTQGQALAAAVHWYAAHCPPLGVPERADGEADGEEWKRG